MTTVTSSRSAKGADTRNRILESARWVLAEEGTDRFTTRRVAERAGVSHGMCHYHFKDKRDLVLALLVHARRDWVEPLEELVDGPGTPEARMRAVISWMAEPATTDVMRVHTALLSFALQDHVAAERLAAEYARWRAPFVRLFEELGLSGAEAKRVGEAFASAADGLVQQQSLDPGLPTERILGSLLRQILGEGRPRSGRAKRG